MTFLEIKNISVIKEKNKILDDLSLQINKGECIAIMGPNGSGKTTLLRIINSLESITSGNLILHGFNISKIGFVFQNPISFATSVYNNVNWTLRARGTEKSQSKKMTLDVLEKLDLSKLANMDARKLSGGETQKLAIARTLVCNPELILLDEPTASLDLGSQIDTFELLLKLINISKKAILVAIHDITLASQYCDRIVLVHEGHKIAEGTPNEVLTVENLHAVYGVETDLMSHPRTGLPVVIPRPITKNKSSRPNYP